MINIDQYRTILKDAIDNIDYSGYPKGLIEPIVYTLESGGKRLRPILTLATCEAFGCDPETAINQAMGVEMFHNFTLLHDDLMDNAATRRGRATVHIRWDERTAILSGDAMLSLSQKLVTTNCPTDKLRAIIDLSNKTAMEVYAGQQLDMDYETEKIVSVDDYIEMIRLKTSVLLGCACQLGAIMAGADEKSSQAMYDYGEKLGLAFQLQDDYLDTYGDPLTFGKDIGGDIVNDKKTWLRIKALEEDSTGVIARETKSPSDPDEKIRKIRTVYDNLNLASRCHALIDEYIDQAIATLDHANIREGSRIFFRELALDSRHRAY